ncbi:plasmid partitioning protein RepB [Ensifer sp.]|jgi:ParB family chromosome partitioning protein|uniref:plasmid partitioning protein RepB n=1 Tax=Ensifer sp. TaxID=1872086 RepID=UPI002E11D162|nr:plasmid partitioning protein RepB [Ensifer sp.]
MSKSSRKSIVASFGLLSAELENKLADEPKPAAPPPSPRVGAGVVGAAHRAIDDIRAERDRLKAIVEAGGGAVLDLDTALIDPSPYPDRLADDDASDFETFKRSIEAEGQKVPIQVRRHPSSAGRYQIVYGHRRWRAARELGKPVRALEVEISDLDLVVAQGIENANRQDLTWIERTLFASRMDDAGIKARNIYAALSIADAELARMRGVYRAIPADVIEAIGRAPKIGRPRWIELAKAITSDPESLVVVRRVLTDAVGGTSVSDQRFQRAFEAVKPSRQPQEDSNELSDLAGRKLGAWKISPKELRISADGPLGVEFMKFVGKELPALMERFSRERES